MNASHSGKKNTGRLIHSILPGLFFFFLSSFVFAQQKKLDSLQLLITSGKEDTLKALNYYSLGDVYDDKNNSDSALIYFDKSFTLSEKLSFIKGISISAFQLGRIYNYKSKNDKALAYYFKALKAREQLNNLPGIRDCYKNIGIVYQNQSNFPKAFDYYFKSLRLNTKLNDPIGKSDDYFNIASIYDEQHEYNKSLDYYFKSLEIYTKGGDKKSRADCYLNIGLVYMHQLNYLKAVEYYFKSLEIAEALNDKNEMSMCYFNIASIYDDLGQYRKSLDNYFKSLKIDESLNDIDGRTKCFINIGTVYSELKDHKKAKEFFTKAKQLAFITESKEDLISVYGGLSDVEKDLGNYKEAYNYHVLFKNITDTVFNIENSKQLSDARTNFEVEKKEGELKTIHNQQEKIFQTEEAKKELEIKNGKFVRNAFIAGTILSLILVFFVYRNLNQSRQANKVIARQKEQAEEQKKLIEIKQKEIIESITYAKNLQTAILPSNEFLSRHINENFIFYRPKDIVAGDFYWAEKIGGLFFKAAADSTGHGVTGAMVSVVCSNALNRTVKEFKLTDPGKILDKTRELVLETFEKSGGEVNDGMDISLLCIDAENKVISWSGANNPLWYIQKDELKEIKANKQPIGKTDRPKPFTTHFIEYNTGTVFYLFTDGLADQFGGPKGKKFKYKQFSQLLNAHKHLPLKEQYLHITASFDTWKGKLEQVDDVCVIGIKL